MKNISELVNDLKEYLLNSDLRDKIVKIILFGSYVKGIEDIDSDIDVLIFTTDGISIKKSLMDKIYDFMLEHDVPLEIILSNIDELVLFRDYFLHRVLHYGSEVYSMEEKEIKMITLRGINELAEEYLESAKEVLDRNRIRLAIDAAYNAAELTAKGLVLLKQDDIPGSHGGVVSLFGPWYIKTREVDKELGRGLNQALRLRNEARYRPNAILSKEHAQPIINLAEALINILTSKIYN